MKKQNPIRSTVTRVVKSMGGRRNKKQSPKTKFVEFFEDLENRGPFTPNSLFERFTKKVHKDMEKAGTWISRNDEDLEFVAEYVARLMQEYFSFRKNISHWEDIYKLKNGKFDGYKKHFLDFRKIYIKIRVWGLRTKRFRLRRWRLAQYPLQFSTAPNLWPFDYSQKYNSNEPTFRYILFPYSYKEKNRRFFEREDILKNNSS